MGKKILLGIVLVAIIVLGWKMYSSKQAASSSEQVSETQNAAKTSVQVLPAESDAPTGK